MGAKKKPVEISDHDQFWLDHQAAQAASGQTAKEYAAAEGMSLHAFYQARKKLRRSGLLAPCRAEAAPTKKARRKRKVSFSKVTVAPAAVDDRFRLELPSGIALEWSGGSVPESVTTLLERLARLS